MNMQQANFTVTGLTVYIRHIFDLDELLGDVWVEGEVSNFSRPSSGHWYFTLKDSTSQLKAVMWKTSAARQRYMPEHGEKVRAHGKVTVYEAGGQYQLYCDVIQPLAKVGDLHAQFRELWDALEAEGLFSPDIKRDLPAFPRKIGVVTSASTAAFQDIQNVLRRRYPLAELILSPTPVQGSDAAPHIVRALRQIDAYGVDVILLARGGGSLEDLWCFNDERIARAIRETRAPVVTGVGHETDTTLVDGTADRRAPTPSAGAEMIVPSIDDLRFRLKELSLQLRDAAQENIDSRREDVDDISHKLRLVAPTNRLRSERQRLDELDMRLEKAARAKIVSLRDKVLSQKRALESTNPRNLLARGYALITRADDGSRVTDAADANPGTSLHIQLSKGTITAAVTERTLDDQPST
ncbi:MAG: exodeoxyribonuclease VII large subunit [Anaerolineae bacterium]|nr:exodeoxyribonuclease VII large subunit [Anaerolineae bacterium]